MDGRSSTPLDQLVVLYEQSDLHFSTLTRGQESHHLMLQQS
jgi:hypothetical protein